MRLARWLVGFSAMGLAACAATPPGPGGAPSASLAGTRWVGVVEGNADPRHLPRLEFVREGRVSGFTGCNMMSGTWTADGGVVKLGPMAATKRFCVGPEMEIERKLLAALGEKARVTQERGRLVFTTDAGRFEFVPAPAGS